MANINFSHFWKSFVSDFIEVQEGKITVTDEVKDYHPIVQRGLCKLGWAYEQDLFHHFSLGRKNERPDFFIKFDQSLKHNQGIPIEVKLPYNVMEEENREQLIEYMRLSDSNIGIYIGEHVRVFYRPSLEMDLKIVIDAAFTNEDLAGIVFAELFFSATFNIESLRTELNKYYELERLIDDKRLKDFDNNTVPEEWLVDRYDKRAQLRQLGSGRKGEKNEINKLDTARLTSVSSSSRIKHEFNEQQLGVLPHKSLVLITKKATTIMPKEFFNALQFFCTNSGTPKHRAIYLFILDGLLAHNIISDEDHLRYKNLSALLTTTYNKRE